MLDRSTAGSDTRKKRSRGKTVGQKISNLQPGERFQVDFDMFSRPIGEHRPDLVTLIGTLVRNTENVPMRVKTWRDIPKELRDKLCQLVQEKFEWKGDRKRFVERRLNNLFRNYRYRLKKQFYDPYPTPQERMAHRPHEISVEDWEYLCNLWSTSEFQAISSRNKVNRRNLEMPHVTGRRSFAQIEVDEVAKSGQSPSCVDMFELTRKRKKGGWTDERAEEVVTQMRELCAQEMSPDEVFKRFLGHDWLGHVRCKGRGPTITDSIGSSASHEGLIERCDDTRREAEEAKRRAELAERRAEAAEGRADAAEKRAELAEFAATEAKQSCSLIQKQLMTLMTELRNMVTGLPLIRHAETSQHQCSQAFDD